MKKKLYIILKIVFAILFIFAHYFIYIVLIKPGIIQTFGQNASKTILAQATSCTFVTLHLILLPIYICAFNPQKLKMFQILIRLFIFITLLFFILAFFLIPEYKLSQVIEITLIYLGFGLGILFFNLTLFRIKILNYWRTLIITIFVFALLSSIIWLNPFFKSIASQPDFFSNSVNIALNLNPAVVIFETILNINIFRSGHFYTQLGGQGLSVIGDYYGIIKFWGGTVFYCLLYCAMFFALYLLTWTKNLFTKRKQPEQKSKILL